MRPHPQHWQSGDIASSLSVALTRRAPSSSAYDVGPAIDETSPLHAPSQDGRHARRADCHPSPYPPHPSLSQPLRHSATDVLAAPLRNAPASSTPGILRTPYR
ncbi:hypothetical protein BD311DRAFT_678097 [Dichomitus squalens]|uniref:Uncharacterized protein n=1 Tax=Dichomitus squalens TaxID=114155 RepID=A0A4Q9M3U6_9APHY|nr:hypothetical protein BD311DRAFT_678097 [Dichomitus squalens]